MKMLKNCIQFAAIAAVSVALTSPAEAHRRWLLPSATVLSGEEETVSVDAAISNELFAFDHHAAPLDDLTVTGPNGQPVAPSIIGTGKYRSVFDVPLAQQGTYRIALASEGMFGSYMLNGERKRWRGSAEAAKTAIPAGATEVRLIPVMSRVETFVTLGAPNEGALAQKGAGVEMVPLTHPNDLVTGEDAQFRFLLDGQPAKGLEVEFVQGNTRYRDDAGIQKLTTDDNGVLTLSAQEPGMYFLETSAGGENGGRRASYSAVLEFQPA